MNTFARKLTRALCASALAAAGLALTGSSASAAAVSIPLCAVAGTAALTGVVTAPIWGFARNTGDCGAVAAALPGPVLEVNIGDDVTIQLTNAIPGHTAAFELAGLPVDSNCTADPGAVCYHFTAARVGTFIYQSPGDAGRQMAMGMAGALVVRPAGEPAGFSAGNCSAAAGLAYGATFDRECLLVLSAVDPNFNNAPDTFNMHHYLATYWLINGKAYPDTAPIVMTGSSGRNLLLRYVNAGFDNTAMMLLGLHARSLARDAYPWNNPFMANTETIPAGGTEDALAAVPASGAPSSGGFPLFNRNLHVTNGSTAAGNYATPGGMLTFIVP
jgi:FtsP/CotA-like multicopper oxidase with cupredoxin domain